MSIEQKFSHILETKNPDKELEYYWLTLRHCFEDHLTSKLSTTVLNYKKTFDKFQKLKMYDKIKKGINYFLENEFTEICWRAIAELDFTVIGYLCTNINRWDIMYDGKTKYDEESHAFLSIIKIYLKKHHKMKNEPYKTILTNISLIAKCVLSNEDIVNYIDEIIILSIKHGLVGTLKYLVYSYPDIVQKYFIKDVEAVSAKKLCRYINKEKIDVKNIDKVKKKT